MTTCTRCESTGFLNACHLPDTVWEMADVDKILAWIVAHPDESGDAAVCDCCGDGEGWYGEPGEHYGPDDPLGPNGPYASNGGLCHCH